MAGVPEHAALC